MNPVRLSTSYRLASKGKVDSVTRGSMAQQLQQQTRKEAKSI